MSTLAPSHTSNDFWDWMGTPFIRVAAVRKHDQWYAVAEDFNIAGVGATEADAYRDVAGLVEAYLRHCFSKGLSFEQSWRRLPRRTKLWNLVRSTIARVLHSRAPAPFAEEGRFMLPSALNGAHRTT